MLKNKLVKQKKSKFKNVWLWISLAILSWSLMGCQDKIESVQAFNIDSPPPLIPHVEKIAEVAPPKLIQELNKSFDQYQPQVKIITPQPDQVLKDDTVNVKLEVKNYPLFKDKNLGLGPHLHLFLDDQPYKAIYNVDEPITFEKLSAGTHTLRVFASRPWHESFKNEGAYAQTTFHVFTTSNKNNPQPDQPLLTYSRPEGNYSAEPIMLDFYLANAPLHLVAQESTEDEIADWRIRAIVNGETFLLDTWQPIYLQGFEKGKNWVKLEFIDENGEIVENAFNTSARVINYNPDEEDSLAKLVKGKLSLEEARVIVEENYQPQLSPITELNKPSVEEENLPVTESTPKSISEEKILPSETPEIDQEKVNNEENKKDTETEVTTKEEKTISPENVSDTNTSDQSTETVETKNTEGEVESKS
jgi:hypothetical protein